MSAAALLADIGGTNARFVLDRGGRRGAPLVLATRDFPTLSHALEHALEELGAPVLSAVATCAAGPPHAGVIAMTNCPWQVSAAELAKATGAPRVVLVNDFTALAAALPVLEPDELQLLGGAPCTTAAPRAVLGPGTGLGVSACLPGPSGDTFITGEGGHVDLAAASDEEDAILERLRQRFGHVSAERVLCGDGLVNLFAAMHPDAGSGAPRSAKAVAALAAAGDERALACLAQFARWLGAVASDLALTLGARGGVYLAGGILPAWGALFPAAAFRERFEDKGRYRHYLAPVPTYMITAAYPAFVGLARLLEHT